MIRKKNNKNSFNSHINNIKEMITYFKDKNHKTKKNKTYESLNIILASVDTIVIIGATSTSLTQSIIGTGSIVFTNIS